MMVKAKRLKIASALLVVGYIIVVNTIIISPANAINPNGFPYNTIKSCIERAYKRSGVTPPSDPEENGIPSIVAACKQCERRDWGKEHIMTISALWFTGTDQDIFSNSAIVDANSNASTAKVRINLATLSCNGNEDTHGTGRLARHNFNIQSKINGNGECPQGTILEDGSTTPTVVPGSNPSAIRIANCKNDGISNKYVNVVFSVWDGIGITRLYIPTDDWGGTSKSTIQSKNYIESAYTYTGDTELSVNGGIANDWSLVSRGSVEHSIDIAKFKNDAEATHDEANHRGVYTSAVYVFSCNKNSWPGMYVNETGSTYHYGCATNANQIIIKFQDPKLTLKAISTTGSSLSEVMSDKSTYGNSVEPTTVSVTRRTNDTYVFRGFITNTSYTSGNYTNYISANSSNDIYAGGDGNATLYVKNLTANRTIYAVYDQSTFIGKTEVSGAASATAGWTNATSPKKESVTTSIENCSPTDGCKVSFKHSLQRKSGIAATTYNVFRSSNLTYSTRAISAGTIKGDTSFSSNSATVVSESENLKLYPGMVVCEKLTFKPNNLPATAGNIFTQVCVHAHGNAQPPDPSNPDEPEDPNKDSGDTSFVNIKVSNPSAATKYHNYQREVYAKPGDTISFRATYNPVLQYTYFLVPQKMRIDDGAIYPTSEENNTKLSLGNLFNTHKGSSLKNWNNAFSVQSGTNNAFDTLVADYNEYNNGETAKKQEINTYTVEASHVGKSINEKAITNLNSTTQTTPSQVNFRDDNSGANLANVITAGQSKIAYARVPFNFKNDTELLINPDELEAYAGEPLAVKYSYIIMPKTNSETSPNEAYSTRVDKPQWRLAVKIGDDAWEYTEPQTQNSFSVSTSEMKTNTNYELSTTINIPDVVAGTEICIVPTVYPTNSGADTNYTDKEGSHAWTEIDTSKQKCLKVAKKPNIEVWGGNVYSRGAIKTSISAKNHLYGYTTYNLNGSSVSGKNRYIFGSWVESGLISNGAVSGLASGAGTGFYTNNNGTLWPAYSFGNNYNGIGNNASVSGGEPRPGGSYEENQNFCIRSTLTFANNDCKWGLAGNFSSATSINSIENDKTSVLSKFIPASYDENTAGDVVLNDDTKIAGNGSYYYYGKDSLTIPKTIGIRKGTIQVVHSDQNITITGDLVYEYDSTDSYATLEEIPKLVIYAQNVNIACTVSRIDALIIAENQVNTCNSNDVDSRDNSNQLKINGAIITNSLEAKRTYGAATGANSIIPAEIINFDPSLYLWGGNDRQGETSANDMDTTYIHEMAPRY